MQPCPQAAAPFFPTIPSPAAAERPAPPTAPSRHATPVRPPIAPGVVGLLIFLGTEAMFFAGLLSAFVILRAGQPAWPPPGQPRFPVGVTGVNTLILLASAVAMRGAHRAARGNRGAAVVPWLTATTLLGLAFVGIQGFEWVRLLHHGLGLSASVYGALFYTIIGTHGLHVLGGLGALGITLGRARRARDGAAAHHGIALCGIYWGFVVAVWPVLYVLVYLM